MAGCLGEFGRVTGVDLSPLALDSCRARRLKRLARASGRLVIGHAGSGPEARASAGRIQR